MRLDNRSRTIVVSGEALATSKVSLQEWYESTGGIVSSESGNLSITYPNREMAEKVGPRKVPADSQALAMGTKDIPNVTSSIQATWHTAPAAEAGHEHAGQDVEMVEDQRRGDMEEDD